MSHNDTFARFGLVSLTVWRALLDLSKTEFEHFAWKPLLGVESK